MAKLATATPEQLKNVPTGPAVGDVVPDFELPNQFGSLVRFSEARAGSRALVLFHRSASW